VTFELKIGRKGEIYTTKDVRERLNISPGDILMVFVEKGMMIAKKKTSALDLLDAPELASISVTPAEMDQLRKELNRFLEQRGALFDS